MNFFQGLYSYEIILLVLGVVLFVVSIVLLLRGKTGLVVYFLVSIIMIGYPSITSIQYKDGAITIEKDTQTLQQDPTNPQARQAVQQELAKFESRPITDPHIATVFARAQFAVGNETAASVNLQKALQADPKSADALQLKQKIDAIQQLDRLSTEVKGNPQNAAAKQELTERLAQATKVPVSNPAALVKLASAQAAMGNQQEALSIVEKAIKINPSDKAAIELKKSILAGTR